MKHLLKNVIRRAAKTLAIVALATVVLLGFAAQPAAAYPFWAQETAPETPREATGRIVCANCHLASKPTEVEMPLAVSPDTVFKAVVKIPYDLDAQQVLGDGSKGGLNVGAVVMLPEGFKIAPADRISEELKEEVGGVYFQPYRDDQENVVIVGPLPGEQYQEIVFPVLSPDPATNKDVHFGKFAMYVGANRGRGQVYPAGNLTNNNVFKASAAGTVSAIASADDGSSTVTIDTADGSVDVAVPAGPALIVATGDTVESGQALTSDPNVGGFGQEEAEIVLQDPTRIQWLLVFFAAIALSQLFLVLKKKQIERVQAAEMNF
ncbi:cytochrome f [Spirulina major]|uniref:cytochrome f n=1 Tax=Spirulina major TaxID=270636 RepID=UPI0009332CA8|nr:apocytochrome f [Spirulina major]